MVHPIPGSGIAQTYLIVDENDGMMVVDVGSVGAARAVEDFCVHTLMRSLQAIRIIAATHFHIDHIGGIAALLSKCSPKTVVLFHPLVKAYLKAHRPLSPMRNWVTGLFPTLIAGGFFGIRKWSDLAFDGPAGVPLPFFCDCQRVSYWGRIRYLEGNRLPRSRIGFGGWEVIAAPGHTEDSVVFYNEASGELITGDLILGRQDGRGYVNRFCWDEGQSQRTFSALAETLRVRIIFPGHGPVIWSAENAFQKVGGGGATGKAQCGRYCRRKAADENGQPVVRSRR
ncbi:MAG: MBL fold metallo-hydrolase [Deltaproteobacteria bacterium]|nr:MBL fold metallo-hydrolase [Deltaproteobacteria bacterium]